MQLPFNHCSLWPAPRRPVSYNHKINERHQTDILDRIKRYQAFKNYDKRICVSTDVFGRGIDIERINLAINYDMPADADSYLHRVGRAGRFGTKGLAISFVSSEQDTTVIGEIEKRFDAKVPEYPEGGVESSTYMAS